MIKREELLAYLQRINIDRIEEPTLEFLVCLHQAHIQFISWQTLDIFMDKKVALCMKDSIGLVLNQRSGYCFHLNQAFYWLLKSLGYQVSIHRAGVHAKNKKANIDGFHVGLLVHFEDDKYLIDVGLGDMPYKPILLQEGIVQQNFSSYRLAKSKVADNAIRLNNDRNASYLGVDYSLNEETTFDIFDTKHAFYYSSEKSPWKNLLIFKNRTEKQVNELKGCIYTSINDLGIEQQEVMTKKQWLELVDEVFYEPLINYSDHEVDRIWLKIQQAHLKWINR